MTVQLMDVALVTMQVNLAIEACDADSGAPKELSELLA